MRIRFMVSHPWNNRPGRIKMARVDGCTFFRRSESDGENTKEVWKHVDKSCERTDHMVYTMFLAIGKCILSLGNLGWKHRDSDCSEVRLWNEIQEKGADKVHERIQKEMRYPIPEGTQMTEDLRKAVKEMDELRAATMVLAAKLEKTKPVCLLAPDDIPLVVGSCEFKRVVGDELHHLSKRCSLREHLGQNGIRQIRVIRRSGRGVSNFADEVNKSIGQALAMVPPGTREHVVIQL